jgi:hypothetical protein
LKGKDLRILVFGKTVERIQFDFLQTILHMRYIGDELYNRLNDVKDLQPLLNHVKKNNELRFEVRLNRDAAIYYRKGLALGLKKMTVNPDYKNVPPTYLAVSNPSEYFERIKQSIDHWCKTVKFRREFDTQQNIARDNQELGDKYLILDMEYVFEQRSLLKNQREKKGAGFDLLGIERKAEKIIFFEVKRGMKATDGDSGIDAHINDFIAFMEGKSQGYFRSKLKQDVTSIILDKIRLGLIPNFELPQNLNHYSVEHIFVFHPDEPHEIEAFKQKLHGRTKLIIVSDNDYKLR